MTLAIKTKESVIIRCRACKYHFVPIPRWQYNNNPDCPSFAPSINETCNDPGHPSYRHGIKSSRCHFIVTAGMITYCADCSHDLAGKTLPLESFSNADVARFNEPGYQE